MAQLIRLSSKVSNHLLSPLPFKSYSTAMTKPSNLDAIQETTKLSWDEWTVYLDKAGGRELSHRAIADLAYAKLDGQLDNAGWWSQSVAVAYEQHIGRRQPGQRSDGSFEAAVSRTIDGPMDMAMQLWLDWIHGKTEFDGIAIAGEVTRTEPARGRHWAVNLADGSRLNADVYPKSESKCIFTITQTKLRDQAAADRWRAYWKTTITTLG